MNLFDKLCPQINAKSPLTYIDIGAMGGVTGYWRQLGNHCHVIAFEPDEREFAKLTSTEKITYLPFALYHSSQQLPFYVSRDSGKSSLYPPNEAFLSDFSDDGRFTTVKEIKFSKEKVKPLDEVLSAAGINSVDFIKLDTQGSELDILKGAIGTLGQLFGIELEVEFSSLYKGQPLFRDVDAFLDAHGFQLIDLRRCFWKKKAFPNYIGRGQLVFGDALYLRRADVFLDVLRKNFQSAQLAEKILKAVVVCMVYRMPDYAVDLLNRALAKGLISEQQHNEWLKALKDEAASWGMPGILGRTFLSKFFNRLSETLKPVSHLGWSDGDRFIGNTRNM